MDPLRIAARIATRLADARPWRDRPAGRSGDASLARGSAGVGLFLAEVERHAPDPHLAAAASDALAHALSAVGQPPVRRGFYDGAAGVAYAAARAGHLLRREDLLGAAAGLVRGLAPPRESGGTPVRGGPCPASLPALLRMADWAEPSLSRAVARQLAEELAASACPTPWGWCWERWLAARAGWGLLEAFAAGGQGALLYAAEQAWRNDELRRDGSGAGWRDPGGEPPDRWPADVVGAASRVRGYELTGDEKLADQAHAAIAAVQTRHGGAHRPPVGETCAVAELLARGGRVFGSPAWEAEAAVLAESVLSRARRAIQGRARWMVRAPGLLGGAAGIGHFLLRVHDPAVPSILFAGAPQPSGRVIAPFPARGEGYERARAEERSHWFGRSLARLARLAIPLEPEAPRDATAPPAPLTLYRQLRPVAARSALAADATAVERARFALMMPAFPAETRLKRVDAGEVLSAPEATFRLSPRARVVRCAYDWGAWDGSGAPVPESREAVYLLARSGDHVAVRPVRDRAEGRLLGMLDQPRTRQALSTSFAEGELAARLSTLVREGVVDCVPGEPGDAFPLVLRDELSAPPPPLGTVQDGVAGIWHVFAGFRESLGARGAGDPHFRQFVRDSFASQVARALEAAHALPPFTAWLDAYWESDSESARRQALDELLGVLRDAFGEGALLRSASLAISPDPPPDRGPLTAAPAQNAG